MKLYETTSALGTKPRIKERIMSMFAPRSQARSQNSSAFLNKGANHAHVERAKAYRDIAGALQKFGVEMGILQHDPRAFAAQEADRLYQMNA